MQSKELFKHSRLIVCLKYLRAEILACSTDFNKGVDVEGNGIFFFLFLFFSCDIKTGIENHWKFMGIDMDY